MRAEELSQRRRQYIEEQIIYVEIHSHFSDGEIRLSVEQNKQFRTLVYARDPTPTPVNYISFASYNNENLSFLFQCATN